MKLKEQFFPAALWKRAIAYIIDMFIVELIIMLPFQRHIEKLGALTAGKSLFESYRLISANEQYFSNVLPQMAVVFIAVAVLSVLYWAILEYKTGQTIGKILMNIYAVPTIKDKRTFGMFVIRSISKVSTFLLAIDSLYIIFTRRPQRLSEKLSNTIVVEKRLTI